MSVVVAAQGLTRTYGAFTAVDDVDLDIEAGEVVGLLGANGAGKTTLIRLLLGTLRPTSGSVALFGDPPTRAQRRRVGYVAQNLGLYRDLTVRENLEFRAGLLSATPSDYARGDRRPVGRLPLGEQRQAAFAAATQHDPELLVLDEPTSGVSPLARSRLWSVIRERADRGTTILVSTHYMDEAEQADRVIIMASGRIVAEGAVADIVGTRRVVEVAAENWPEALRALDRPSRILVLDGRAIRVLGEDAATVRAELQRASIQARTRIVPASLNETLVELSRNPSSSGTKVGTIG
ncbi:MAG TPA: ABC transporter ATP-binding protein [Acidimicrobiia bacterium]|nr:ABC transporter ATP-binding protein [Acidimicrobiia bacterium]